MSVSGIGGLGSSNKVAAQASAGSGGDDAVQSFLNYMKKSPAQRMIDAWLKAHGLTEQALQNMPAVQREAIQKEMTKEIAEHIKDKTQSHLVGLGG